MAFPDTTDGVVFNPKSGCYYPVLRVEVFINVGNPKFGGIHYATVAWEAEEANDGSNWYSGWFAPHNDSGTFHHNDNLDCRTLENVMKFAELFIERRVVEKALNELGITNQRITRSFRR